MLSPKRKCVLCVALLGVGLTSCTLTLRQEPAMSLRDRVLDPRLLRPVGDGTGEGETGECIITVAVDDPLPPLQATVSYGVRTGGSGKVSFRVRIDGAAVMLKDATLSDRMLSQNKSYTFSVDQLGVGGTPIAEVHLANTVPLYYTQTTTATMSPWLSIAVHQVDGQGAD